MEKITGKETNEELALLLPDIKKAFDIMSSKDFEEYEKKLDKTTDKAMDALQSIIDDGSLQLDPEQLVRAVDALSKAKMSVIDSRRRLLETMIKGQVMMKALEPPKDRRNNSALDDFLSKQKNLAAAANVNSVFMDIEKSGN